MLVWFVTVLEVVLLGMLSVIGFTHLSCTFLQQETGIGKTVNSFRKHATAGNVAKSLVKKWKKLIPPEDKR